MGKIDGIITVEDQIKAKSNAKQLAAKHSPDLSETINVRIDSRTILCFKPGSTNELIKRKVKKYKQSLKKITSIGVLGEFVPRSTTIDSTFLQRFNCYE